MNTAFSANLVKLRKARGLSQKSAAEGLQISQALLSHYEKGIRECGLEFLIRAAEFYNVSCDYLLGRTEEKTFISDIDSDSFLGVTKNKTESTFNILFAILQKINSDSLNIQVSSCLDDMYYLLIRSLLSEDIYNFQLSKHKGTMTGISKLIEHQQLIEDIVSQTELNKLPIKDIINCDAFDEIVNSAENE